MSVYLLPPDAFRCLKRAQMTGHRCDREVGHEKPHVAWTLVQGRPAERRSWWVE